MSKRWLIALIVVALAGIAMIAYALWQPFPWTEAEVATLRSLSVASLPEAPVDPSNRYADDPQAASLGHQVFFDTRFSANGQVACATCHLPDQQFQDGLPLAQGVGTTTRRTMPLAGVAHSPWLFWDGRSDSLWAQALEPLESAVEHGGNRTQYVHLLAEHYREPYEAIFGPLPDLSHLPPSAGPVDDVEARAAWDAMTLEDQTLVNTVFANMGKAIAAYERQLQPGPGRFDAYVEAVTAGNREQMAALFTPEEAAGLALFIGEANCLQCHNGPLFTDNHFHNTGVPAAEGLPDDTGRLLGAQQVLANAFNCLGAYSDAGPRDCTELRYMVAEGHELERAFRAPSLRNVADRPPYMHAGQIATLEDVLRHYNSAPAAPSGHSEIVPLGLSDEKLAQLEAFLNTLTGPLNAEPHWLEAPTAS
jgi:cytochrome c peroxidase